MFNRKKRRAHADLIHSLTKAAKQANEELRAINKRLERLNEATRRAPRDIIR